MRARVLDGLRSALVGIAALVLLAGCSVQGNAPPMPTLPNTVIVEVTVPERGFDQHDVDGEVDAITAQLEAVGVTPSPIESQPTDQLAFIDTQSIQITVDQQDVDVAVAALNRLTEPFPVQVTGVWGEQGQDRLRLVAGLEFYVAVILYILAPILVAILLFGRAFGGEPERRKWWLIGLLLIPFWWLAALIWFIPRSRRGAITFAAAVVAVGVGLWGLWLLGDGRVFVFVNQSPNGSNPELTPAFPFPALPDALMEPAGIVLLTVGLAAVCVVLVVAQRLRTTGGGRSWP